MSRLKNLFDRLHEKKLYFELKMMKLPKEGIVIDCGANVGKFSSVFAQKGIKVVSFEPNQHAFKVLKTNLGKYQNVQLIEGAVWIEDTELPLFHHVNSNEDEVLWSTGSSLVIEKSNVSKDKAKLVKAYDLAKFIKDLNRRVNILKIDIEGAEVEVLNKLIDEGVHKLCDKVFVETHPQIESKRQGLKDLEARIKSLSIKNIRLDWI